MEHVDKIGENLCVMVVEDEPVMNELEGEILRFHNFAVRSAFTGEEALRDIAEEPPDAVLLDIMLPGISGYEVCQQLKAARATNPVPVIMLTALDRKEDRMRGIRVGADAYITKPFDPEALVDVLRKTIDRIRGRISRGQKGHIELSLQEDLQYLMEVNDLLLGLYARSPLSEKEVQEIRYCLLEMDKNAREWARRHDRNVLIHIEYALGDDELQFVLRDESERRGDDHPPGPAATDDPLAGTFVRDKLGLGEGGFGILLSPAFINEVARNPEGDTVTLTKRFVNSPE